MTVPSGIQAVDSLPWGSHFCHFFESKTDLSETLVPFFKAGLENNERCLWVTSEPFQQDAARESLLSAVPDLAAREKAGQIEIIDYRNWYLRSGRLSAEDTASDWVARARQATTSGYKGLRLSGNTFWLESDSFDEFADYERL